MNEAAKAAELAKGKEPAAEVEALQAFHMHALGEYSKLCVFEWQL